MPTATLTFDLDTEREQFDEAVNGWAYRATLQDLDEELRRERDLDTGNECTIAWAQRLIFELAENHGVEVW